ncbi:hypothetical protein HJFPF1_11365 [Paramyrothecium foliicola]|nr:hypothetical protein HJFPF1_11365 [Paramyrothecium foliicola]
MLTPTSPLSWNSSADNVPQASGYVGEDCTFWGFAAPVGFECDDDEGWACSHPITSQGKR